MLRIFEETSDGLFGLNFDMNDPFFWPIVIVAGLIVIVAVISLFVSIWLGICYFKFNRKANSLGKNGQDIARSVLDKNGLEKIAVKCSGSFLFGNSYSHYFKKVRLRRLTWKKSSVSSLAMAYQKSYLAVLDKENDPDMKKRIVMTPLIYFGPLAFVPFVLIGLVIDIIFLKSGSLVFTLVGAGLGLAFFVLAFVMSLLVLKTEVKAQQKALEAMKGDGVSDSDIADCKKLFRLYNIEYVNDMIMALLELVLRILQILSSASSSGAFTSSSGD